MKWRGAGHRILEDNLATPPRETPTHSQPFGFYSYSVDRGTIFLDFTPDCWLQVLPWMLFPDGLGGWKRGQRLQGFAYTMLSGTSWVSDCSYRTERVIINPENLFFFVALQWLRQRFRVLCGNTLKSMLAFWWNQEVSWRCLCWCLWWVVEQLTGYQFLWIATSTFANINTHPTNRLLLDECVFISDGNLSIMGRLYFTNLYLIKSMLWSCWVIQLLIACCCLLLRFG